MGRLTQGSWLAFRGQGLTGILPRKRTLIDRTSPPTGQRRLQIPLQEPRRGYRVECTELLLQMWQHGQCVRGWGGHET